MRRCPKCKAGIRIFDVRTTVITYPDGAEAGDLEWGDENQAECLAAVGRTRQEKRTKTKLRKTRLPGMAKYPAQFCCWLFASVTWRVGKWLTRCRSGPSLLALGPPLRWRDCHFDGRPRSRLVDSLHFQQQAHIGWVRARRFELAEGGGGT